MINSKSRPPNQKKKKKSRNRTADQHAGNPFGFRENTEKKIFNSFLSFSVLVYKKKKKKKQDSNMSQRTRKRQIRQP